MAGFGAAKKLQGDNEVTLKETDDTKLNVTEAVTRYASLKEELSTLVANKLQTHLFVGIAGHENTGKTAIVLDAFSSDEEAALMIIPPLLKE